MEMGEITAAQQVEKLCRIWSERRERDIAVCIRYSVDERSDGKLLRLDGVEEFG